MRANQNHGTKLLHVFPNCFGVDLPPGLGLVPQGLDLLVQTFKHLGKQLVPVPARRRLFFRGTLYHRLRLTSRLDPPTEQTQKSNHRMTSGATLPSLLAWRISSTERTHCQ